MKKKKKKKKIVDQLDTWTHSLDSEENAHNDLATEGIGDSNRNLFFAKAKKVKIMYFAQIFSSSIQYLAIVINPKRCHSTLRLKCPYF